MAERAEDWTWNSLWRWRHPTEHQEKPIFRPWPIPRAHDWVTRVNQALTKKIGEQRKPLSSEAAPSAHGHGKRQPPNNLDSNPHFAPEAYRKWRSTTENPHLLDLSPFHFSTTENPQLLDLSPFHFSCTRRNRFARVPGIEVFAVYENIPFFSRHPVDCRLIENVDKLSIVSFCGSKPSFGNTSP